MIGRSRHSGFSFLELILVVSILAVITTIIIPLYGPSVSALQRRSAQGDFVATLYYLQELSIRQSRELHLCIDTRDRSYWAEEWVSGLADEAVYAPLTAHPLNSPRSFPEGLEITRIDAPKDRTRPIRTIAFYPNGTGDPASIRFGRRNDPENFYAVELTGALGEIVVTP